MRRELTLWCGVVCLSALAGCGTSEEARKVEEVEKAAEQVQDSAGAMAKGLEDMAKGFQGLQGLTGGDPSQKPVDPVGFRDLQTAFGDLPGWEKGKPTGERMTNPINYSQAKVTYRKGEQSIEAEISDSAFNQLMLVPFAMFLTAGYEKETDHGYEKSIKVGDFPGWEKWDAAQKDGELSALVNKRFVVQLSGRNLTAVTELQAAMQSVDLQKLAGLK
ncbi:MAG: hypothetical protein GEU82_06975 [Luteitalea sp.]|nr:hypothetical protein [Luteitalea sp.]